MFRVSNFHHKGPEVIIIHDVFYFCVLNFCQRRKCFNGEYFLIYGIHFPVMCSMVIYEALGRTDDDSAHQPTIETPPFSDRETLLDLTNNGSVLSTKISTH